MSNGSNHNGKRKTPPTGTDPTPPNKRQKRTRTFRDGQNFTKIINKLSKSHLDHSLFQCFKYEADVGVICKTCDEDKTLKGYYTINKPTKEFNYSKLLKHIGTKKHYERITDTALKSLHPLHGRAQQTSTTTHSTVDDNVVPSCPSPSVSMSSVSVATPSVAVPLASVSAPAPMPSISVPIPSVEVATPSVAVPMASASAPAPVPSISVSIPSVSDLDRIHKSIALIHLVIKLGLSLAKVKPLMDFYGAHFIQTELSSDRYIDEILNAMNVVQVQTDLDDVLGADQTGMLALAVDVEHKSGAEKWLQNVRRESVLTEKEDKILRVFSNSPEQTESEFADWLRLVAQEFWKAAKPQIECQELDELCKD